MSSCSIDQFISLSDRLANALSPCIIGVLNGLHAKRLIGYVLKDELISSSESSTVKATKLVTALEGLLHNDSYPKKFLKTLCTVLKDQGERQLTEIAELLLHVHVG